MHQIFHSTLFKSWCIFDIRWYINIINAVLIQSWCKVSTNYIKSVSTLFKSLFKVDTKLIPSWYKVGTTCVNFVSTFYQFRNFFVSTFQQQICFKVDACKRRDHKPSKHTILLLNLYIDKVTLRLLGELGNLGNHTQLLSSFLGTSSMKIFDWLMMFIYMYFNLFVLCLKKNYGLGVEAFRSYPLSCCDPCGWVWIMRRVSHLWFYSEYLQYGGDSGVSHSSGWSAHNLAPIESHSEYLDDFQRFQSVSSLLYIKMTARASDLYVHCFTSSGGLI
jgi:hypothetical protein